MIYIGKNTNGVPFNSRIVKKGEAYGRDNCLVHEEDEPVVEFFDARYPFWSDTDGQVLGQFVSSYYVKTLLSKDGCSTTDSRETGIDLHGGEPDWFVTGEQVAKALEYLK